MKDLKKLSNHYPYGCKPVFKIKDIEDDKFYTVHCILGRDNLLSKTYTGVEFKKSAWVKYLNKTVFAWEEM